MDYSIRPKISIVIPIHNMKGGANFLWKSINALMEQNFQDFEIVITKQGKMANNTNAGINYARGEYIKILYLDDTLAHPNALQEMVDAIGEKKWLICGCDTNEFPYYTEDIQNGNNKLGSPSCLMIKNDQPMLFDENMSWLLDCDYYKRMYQSYGEPVILEGVHVNMGVGDHQMTHILTYAEKRVEEEYINRKYD